MEDVQDNAELLGVGNITAYCLVAEYIQPHDSATEREIDRTKDGSAGEWVE
jgi:hypothetical protein